jgi:acyl dehydratase
MGVPNRFILHQGRVIAAMGRVALGSLIGSKRPAPELPGPERREVLPPRSPDLVRHYVKLVGGDPATYRSTLPAHLFPQWGFPIAMQTLVGLDVPLARGLNAGCSLRMHAPLPQGEPLEVRSRLERIDDDGRRVILEVRVITGTASAPDALEGLMAVVVPLKKGDGKKERPRVSESAREIAFRALGADMGLAYAKLTGDFNPVHWVPAYARASGFSNCILHGFATMAIAMEALDKTLFAGNSAESIDVRFTRPLVLPAAVGVYVEGDSLWVGDAPGGRAYLSGRFTG